MIPNLKNPPKKLNLENNLLKTNKYKLLRLFISHKGEDRKQVEKYLSEKRKKHIKYTGKVIYQEREELKNDPIEFLETQKTIRKMDEKKAQESDQIPSISTYVDEQVNREIK